MHRITTPFIILITAISCSLFSCVTQRKTNNAKKELKSVDSILIKQDQALKEIDDKRKMKVDANELDDTGSARISRYIDKTRAEISKMHEENTIRIGEAVIEKADWDRLLKTLSFSRKSSKDIGDKISFLKDLVNRNMVIRIDQDVVFEPGKYTVSEAMTNAIGKLFEPAAVEIDLFIKKYPDFPLSLVITAKGYADATTIAEGSALYRELKDKMKLSSAIPDNKAMNKELSVARAFEVITLFKKFGANRAENKMYLENVLYLHQGKGEDLPNPKVTDYKVDDARRRVVYLFWSVFPE